MTLSTPQHFVPVLRHGLYVLLVTAAFGLFLAGLTRLFFAFAPPPPDPLVGTWEHQSAGLRNILIIRDDDTCYGEVDRLDTGAVVRRDVTPHFIETSATQGYTFAPSKDGMFLSIAYRQDPPWRYYRLGRYERSR